MKAFSALVLASAGCAMVSMALVRSRVLWLGLGFPLIAIGLWMSGWRMSPRAFFQWAARFCAERDRDCEVLWSMALEVPREFRCRRNCMRAVVSVEICQCVDCREQRGLTPLSLSNENAWSAEFRSRTRSPLGPVDTRPSGPDFSEGA